MATVTTYVASSVTTTTATLNGLIDEAGEALTCGFVWNGNVVNVGYKQNQPFSANITGLDAGTTYWYYARAWDGIQWITGSTLYFTTDEEEEEPPPPPPITITTSAASNIRRTSATLNGSIANCTAPMQCRFLLNSAPYSVGYMYNTSFSYNMTGLSAGTTYTFKAQYWNGSTWVSGAERTFTTRSTMTQTVGGTFGMTGAESDVGRYQIPVSGSFGAAGELTVTAEYNTHVAGEFGLEGVLETHVTAQHESVAGDFGMVGELTSRTPSSSQNIAGEFGMTGALTAELSHTSTDTRHVGGLFGMTGAVTGVYHLKITETLTGATTLTGVLRMARVIQTDTIMLLSDLLAELGTMLNELNQADSQPFEYTPAQLVRYLNRSQDQILTMVPAMYFTSLHMVDSDIALDSDGAFAISDLTRDILLTPKNIMAVRVDDDKYSRLISFKEYLEHQRSEYVYGDDAPIHYIRGTTVYVEPYDTGDTVDVYYIRKPVNMVMNTTGDTDDDTNCELPLELKGPLIDFAASYGYSDGNDSNRALFVFNRAMGALKEIKDSVEFTDSTSMAITRHQGVNPFRKNTVSNIYRRS